uniref:N-acetyltransferase domain-containing protein n=2 Tax=Heterosigma akashiwo TaxID=2829 RepID=A0A7S3XWM8_HETAK
MQPLLEDAAVLGRCAAFDAAMDAPYFEKDFGDPSQIIGITDLKFSIRRWPPWNDQVRVAARARRGGAGVGNCLAVLQRRTGAAMDRAVSRAFPERPRARGARAAPMLSVFVEPAFRGAPAGVGALLMRRLLRHLRRRGYQYMVVTIDDDGSGRLYRWYEKLGFRYLELPGAEEEGGRLMIVEVENDLEGPVKHEPVRKLES